jgi:hypothetical protein
MPIKPTGTSGPVRVSMVAGASRIEQLTIKWPLQQKDIERKIFGYFAREFERLGAKFLHVEDGGLRELDFLLTLPGGKTWLELMEVVVPRKGEIPHRPGQQAHGVPHYVDKVFEGVTRKIRDYGFRHQYPVHLLLYTTHEQYIPSVAAVEMLRIRFKEVRHPFDIVFFITPLAEDATPLTVIFSSDHPIATVASESLASQSWISLPGAETKLL